MKKLTSVVLSVLMVVSLFSCLFTGTTVSAEGTESTVNARDNLIINGNFENGTKINIANGQTTLPSIGGRSVKDVFPTDKTNGQWYRSGAGVSPTAAPDLKYNNDTYSIYDTASDTVYPTYFGPSDQIVPKPEDHNNHVLRAIQDLYTQVEPKDNGKYTLSFQFKLPHNDTGLTNFELFFVSPKLSSDKSTTSVKYPFSITSATLGRNTTEGITIETKPHTVDEYSYKSLRINFSKTNTAWQKVEVAIKTEKVTHQNAQPDVYKVDETDYTSPVLVKIGFDTDGINLTDQIKDDTITNATSYRKKAIYFDDFAMYEVVNCVGAAEFYDVNGNPLPDEQAYTKVTTTVGGEATSTVCVGDEVTATVADYDTTSGAYRFLGWYKDDEKVTKGLSDDGMSVTFTAAVDETYTPRFGSTNLLGGAASFEGYADNAVISHKNDANNPNPPTNDDWTIVTWFEVRSVHGEQTQHCYNGTDDASEKSDPTKYSTRQVSPRSGNVMLKFNTHSQTAVRAIPVTPNTQYKLTFYVNAPDFRNRFTSAVISPSYDSDTDSVAKKTLDASLYGDNYAEWKKVEMEFNSGNNKTLYLRIVKTASTTNNTIYNNCFIDDMVLVKAGNANSVSADVEFQDAKGNELKTSNEYASATLTSNFDGTYTATVNYDRDSGAYAFKGWYYSGKLVSTDETFAFDIKTYTNLTKLKAVITSANLLGDAGSFEGYENNKLISYNVSNVSSNPPTGDQWAAINYYYVKSVHGNQTQHCYEGSDDANEKSDPNKYSPRQVSPRSGNVMLKFETDSQAAVRAIPVTPNTQYKLTFYINVPDYQNRFTEIYLCNSFSTVKQPSVHIYKQSLSKNFYGDNYDKWKKVEMEFNSDNNKTLYLYIVKTASTNPNVATTKDIYNDCFIDDMSLVAMSSANVKFMNTKGKDITAECANEAKPAITNSEKPGYLVAKADYDDNAFDFKGWYNGDTLLSPDKSFEFVSGAYTTLTAKVVSRNILSEAASFEDYNVGTQLKYTGTDYPSGAYFGANKNAGYLGQTKVEIIYDNEGNKITQQAGGDATPASNGVSAVVTSNKAHTGEKSVLVQNNFFTASMGIDVKPNTDYVLSYYVLAPKYLADKTVNTIERSAISTTVNTGGNSNAVAPANVALNSANSLYLDSKILTELHDGENWIKVTHSFNSMNLDKVYLVISQTSIGGIATSTAYIDDLTCYAENLTADDLDTVITEYKASNIRNANGEKAQALRHQFEIQKDLITNGNALYGELVEYGSVAIRTDYLGNRELVKDGVYNYNGKNRNAVTGVAYNKDEGINKIYIENENSIIFTAALTGIGKTSSGTNYNAFGNSYTVRNYVIFRDRNTRKETIVYGAKVEGCVFDVMKKIMTDGPTSTNPKVQNDYGVLKDIFNSDTYQKQAYEDWANQSAE